MYEHTYIEAALTTKVGGDDWTSFLVADVGGGRHRQIARRRARVIVN